MENSPDLPSLSRGADSSTVLCPLRHSQAQLSSSGRRRAGVGPFTPNFQNVFPKNKGFLAHSHGTAETVQKSESDVVRAQLPGYDMVPAQHPASPSLFVFSGLEHETVC